MERRVALIDLDTGELLEQGVPVWVGRKVPTPYTRWATMNQDFLTEFASRTDVRNETFRVFIYLSGRLDFENLIHIPQVEIAAALHMRRQHVGRAMKQLEDLGVLLRGPKFGKLVGWRLNPNAGWKGKVRLLRSALDARDQTAAAEEAG